MSFAILSYGSAAVAYGLLIVLLLLGREQRRQGQWLVVAVFAASAWGALVAASLMLGGSGAPSPIAYSVDSLRTLVWTLCLVAVLPGDPGWRSAKGLLSLGATAIAVLTLVSVLLLRREDSTYPALLGGAIVGCLAIEQIFRNSTDDQKRVLRSFLWTVAVIFAFDLFVFSDAVLFQAIDVELWAMRGFLATLAVPVFVLAAKRHPDWQKTLFISRKVVFYSTTLTGVGLYLIAMGVAGLVIRERGGAWGMLGQFSFFIAAVLVLAAVLASAKLRSSIKMFISKNFYRHQYEYRDEWLRLIRTLSSADSELPLDHRGIKALAEIIASPGGQMWLTKTARSAYEPFAAWQAAFPSGELAREESPLIRFLNEQQWVIDSNEYERDPELYGHVFRDRAGDLPKDSVVVPLFHQNELLAVVRLVRPKGMRALNYEDHDLLKTAGRQVAAFLAHDLAREQLAETRQFEAYSKLSAFVMHDVKNLLAQQALLVENAKKHQHRPEFIADVISTVDHGVQRMRRLLRQLEQDSRSSHEQRVELNSMLKEVIASCARGNPVPISYAEQAPIWVIARADRMRSVFTHVITNAQEATRGDGSVEIELREDNRGALIEVHDRGEGMSEEFVRRRLFKPFDTTKGASGMGIGAYQAREIIRGLGGDITVRSQIGEGTLVTICLPVSRAVSVRQVNGVPE